MISDPVILDKRVRKSFHDQQFMGFLGAELTSVESGEIEIRLPFSNELTQQHGLFHGGVIATMADNASGFAGFSMMSEDEQPLSIEFKINFMSKGEGTALIARAKVLKNGRRIKFCQSDVYCETERGEQLCATALVSVIATKAV